MINFAIRRKAPLYVIFHDQFCTQLFTVMLPFHVNYSLLFMWISTLFVSAIRCILIIWCINNVKRCCKRIIKSSSFLISTCWFIADGATKSGTVYSGKIGSKISGKIGLVMGPMVQFEPVPGRVAHVDLNDLKNQDEKLLLGYCLLVQNGPQGDEDLNISHRKPGKVCASRWVTTASSILCLYTQTESPSTYFKLIVGFILNPALFLAKGDWHCSKGQSFFSIQW